jgi:LysR family transcriptional activator of nhaA
MEHLNYHHLQYFWMIAKERSITKAAEKLKLGQPTLSMQLKIFEESLGHKLMDRSSRNLELTEMGKLVFQYAEKIFASGEELLAKVKSAQAGGLHRATVCIGILDSIPKTSAKKFILSLYQAGASRVIVQEVSLSEMLEKLFQYELDALLLESVPGAELTQKWDPRVKVLSQKFLSEPVVIAGSKIFANLRQNYPESLRGQPFLVPTEHSKMRGQLESFLAERGIEIDVLCEAQDTGLLRVLAMEKQALIVVPQSLIQEQPYSETMIEVGEIPGQVHEVHMVIVERQIPNQIVDLVFRQLALVWRSD